MFCLVPMGIREVFWYPWGARDTLFCVGEILFGAQGGARYILFVAVTVILGIYRGKGYFIWYRDN